MDIIQYETDSDQWGFMVLTEPFSPVLMEIRYPQLIDVRIEKNFSAAEDGEKLSIVL